MRGLLRHRARSRCQHLIQALRQDDMPEPWRERGGDTEGATKATPIGRSTPAAGQEGGEA